MKAKILNQMIPKQLGNSDSSDTREYRDLRSLIAQQPFFDGLTGRQIYLLTDSAMEMQFNAGQSIFQAGSPANRFHLILEGKVVLESEAASRGIIAIKTLGPGDGLGWSWLFPPFYLKLNARALEPTRTIFFYGTRLREQCEQDHELGYQLMKRSAELAIKCLGATQQRLMECADMSKLRHAVEPKTSRQDRTPVGLDL
jgi:CRP-like cAMP-binding protein